MTDAQFTMRQIGSDSYPEISPQHFLELIDIYGFNVTKKRNASTITCPCYDTVLKQLDPACTICNGSGSLTGWSEEIVRCHLQFNIPNGQFGVGHVYTMAGEMERTEAVGFFGSNVDIKIGDIIVITQTNLTSSPTEVYEMKIYNTMPRMVGDSAGNLSLIFTRADMRHIDYPTTIATVDRLRIE